MVGCTRRGQAGVAGRPAGQAGVQMSPSAVTSAFAAARQDATNEATTRPSRAMWDAIAAEGGPRRSPAEAVAAVAEAITVIRTLWTPGPAAHVAGQHYRLDGVLPGPFPAHAIKIWLGAYQPRMQRLIGRVADGWLPSSPFLPPEALPIGNKIIDEAAVAAGRSPRAVRRLYNVTGTFSRTEQGFLQGPPKLWIEQLADLTLTEGISAYLLYRIDAADFIRRFAEEVAPGVREIVDADRARRG